MAMQSIFARLRALRSGGCPAGCFCFFALDLGCQHGKPAGSRAQIKSRAMGKASRQEGKAPKEKAEKKTGVDWSRHEAMYRQMKEKERGGFLGGFNPLEDPRCQFVVGVGE